MAEFKSRYPQLGFYVNGEYKRFDGGRFVADDKETIEVLTNISDVERVDVAKAQAKPEAKPAKSPARKSSAK